jgi:hypothetical protein
MTPYFKKPILVRPSLETKVTVSVLNHARSFNSLQIEAWTEVHSYEWKGGWPHDHSYDEGEDRDGRLDGGGVGGVDVAEAKKDQQLVAKYTTL